MSNPTQLVTLYDEIGTLYAVRKHAKSDKNTLQVVTFHDTFRACCTFNAIGYMSNIFAFVYADEVEMKNACKPFFLVALDVDHL